MSTAAYEGLVDLPYCFGGTDPRSGIDCLWITQEALRRIFPDFDPRELPAAPGEIEAALALGEYASPRARWRAVGTSAFAARQLGDLLHGRTEDGHPFVSVLVHARHRLAIAATERARRSFVVPVHRLLGVEHVFRRVS